jgi:hypothetical protein
MACPAQLVVEDGTKFPSETTLQQYAIKANQPDGQTKLLADDSGALTFDSRSRAERVTWRLAYCNSGDLYEVTSVPNSFGAGREGGAWIASKASSSLLASGHSAMTAQIFSLLERPSREPAAPPARIALVNPLTPEQEYAVHNAAMQRYATELLADGMRIYRAMFGSEELVTRLEKAIAHELPLIERSKCPPKKSASSWESCVNSPRSMIRRSPPGRSPRGFVSKLLRRLRRCCRTCGV